MSQNDIKSPSRKGFKAMKAQNPTKRLTGYASGVFAGLMALSIPAALHAQSGNNDLAANTNAPTALRTSYNATAANDDGKTYTITPDPEDIKLPVKDGRGWPKATVQGFSSTNSDHGHIVLAFFGKDKGLYDKAVSYAKKYIAKGYPIKGIIVATAQDDSQPSSWVDIYGDGVKINDSPAVDGGDISFGIQDAQMWIKYQKENKSSLGMNNTIQH